MARRARPCDVSAPETAKAPPTPRALASGRSTAEDLGGARICSAAAARRPACPAGEILVLQRLAAAPAGSSDHRDMQGRACRVPRGSEHRASARSTSPVDSGHRTAPNLQSCARRRASATLDGDKRCRSGRPCRSRSYAPMAQISETVKFLRSPRPRTRLSARCRLDQETLARVTGKGETRGKPTN
jgi:hypothetical protein